MLSCSLHLSAVESCYLYSYSCQRLLCTDIPRQEVCSCHQGCQLFNDCCHDVEAYYERCFTTTYERSETNTHLVQFDCIEDELSLNNYWMVATCPSDWTGVDNCSGLDTVGRLDNGLEAIPVFSTTTGVTFKNVYCAICNSELLDDLQTWSLYGDCLWSIQQNRSRSETIEVLTESCLNTRLAPPKDQWMSNNYFVPCLSPYIENMISSCPDTYIESTVANESIINLCNDAFAPLTVNNITFRNNYCTVCYFLASEDEISLSTCVRSTFLSYGGSLPISRFNIFAPLSLSFNLNSNDDECDIDEVFDELKKECAFVGCPKDYEPVSNNCAYKKQTAQIKCEQVEVEIMANVSMSEAEVCNTTNHDPEVSHLLTCIEQHLGINVNQLEGVSDYSECIDASRSKVIYFTGQTQSAKFLEDLVASLPIGEVEEIQSSDECRNVNEIQMTSQCGRFDQETCFSNWYKDLDIVIQKQEDGENFNVTLLNDQQWQDIVVHVANIKLKYNIQVLSGVEVSTRRWYQFSSSDSFPCGIATCRQTFFVNASEFTSSANDSDLLVSIRDNSWILRPDQFRWEDNDTIEICAKDEPTIISGFSGVRSIIVQIMYITGTMSSVVGLTFSLITYGVFPSLRSTISKLLTMILCLNLLIATISFVLVSKVTNVRMLCGLIAWSVHYFFLATFSTSSLIGCHFIHTFSFKVRSSTSKMSTTSVALNMLFCYGVPSVISLALYICQLVLGRDRVYYGDQNICIIGDRLINIWFFSVPLGLNVVFNAGVFVYVVTSLCIQTRGNKSLARNNDTRELFNTFLIFIKVSIRGGSRYGPGVVKSDSHVGVGLRGPLPRPPQNRHELAHGEEYFWAVN